MIGKQDKNIKWWLGVISCIVLFSAIGIFAYMKMSFLVEGIQIEAKIERNDNTPLTIIRGTAKNAIHISLNGREIYIDKDGSFAEAIILIPGLSVVTIDASDKFGKNKKEQFQLVYKEEAPSVAMLSN